MSQTVCGNPRQFSITLWYAIIRLQQHLILLSIADGNAFFPTAGTDLGVMLNVDWFQPYKHTNHSCGVIYLVLMNMRSKNGSLFPHPKNLYCFKKLSDSLRSLLTRPGFLEKCESWRNRKPTANSMADVFDGKVWKEFLDSDGNAFFSTAGNLGVTLNVDWFQPYKHTNHSCGVIYLVLMNLPREERFKPENYPGAQGLALLASSSFDFNFHNGEQFFLAMT